MSISPVHVASTAGWITSIFSGGTFAGILYAILKQVGPWRQQSATERDKDFQRLREDIIEVKQNAKDAQAIAQRLENMVACMRPAISILMAEVKRLDPNSATNPAMGQVQELMGMAASGDMGFGNALVRLSTTPGKGE